MVYGLLKLMQAVYDLPKRRAGYFSTKRQSTNEGRPYPGLDSTFPLASAVSSPQCSTPPRQWRVQFQYLRCT